MVGCDGANSTIRDLVGIPITDRAFFYDWLVVDVVFDEPRVFDPLNVQICDPARPTTVVSGGPGRRRWEFMALPGESIEILNDEATAWRLLEPWDAHPDNAVLETHAVYRFQARWVEQWRRGRVAARGRRRAPDPPFAGQGLCTGLRDAANLAWKLDLVVRDLAPDALLDTYGRERGPHTEAVIELAMDMGKLICVADRAEAAGRDEAFFATYDGSVTDVPPFPSFADGVVLAGSPGAGDLFIQGWVDGPGGRARFDDAVGAGFRLHRDDRGEHRRRHAIGSAASAGRWSRSVAATPGSSTWTAPIATGSPTTSLSPCCNDPTSQCSGRRAPRRTSRSCCAVCAASSLPREIDFPCVKVQHGS